MSAVVAPMTVLANCPESISYLSMSAVSSGSGVTASWRVRDVVDRFDRQVLRDPVQRHINVGEQAASVICHGSPTSRQPRR